ncbi:hypothetical protein ACQPZ2_17130 [Nocardia pseudovaccinii]|uniref:hypothetical protein n=1 Tax=Nocardia pseudovaccinii TaxID=189540 RepID=UPI003D907FA9
MTIGLATDGSAATTRDAILLVPEHEDPIRIDDWGLAQPRQADGAINDEGSCTC